MAATDDRRTANRAQAAELFVKHSEELLAFFRAVLPLAKGEARDLLQQTFEELLKWLDSDPSHTIDHGRGLLFTIARRRVCAFHQRQVRTPATADAPREPPADERPDDATARQDDLEYLASLHEARRDVLRAMRRMDAATRGEGVGELQLLVYLRFFAGMTETEVGEVLERPRATIAGQLGRARVALERELAALEHHEPGVPKTSTTLLQHWWSKVEARASEVARTDPDEPSVPESSLPS